MNMTPEQIKNTAKQIALENEKFNNLLNEVEEKLGLESPNNNNNNNSQINSNDNNEKRSLKKKKKSKRKKKSRSAEKRRLQIETGDILSPREHMNIKYGEKHINDMSEKEIYAAIRKRSPGPIIQPINNMNNNNNINNNANDEIRAEFASLPNPDIPVIRYSETLDWRNRERPQQQQQQQQQGVVVGGNNKLSQHVQPIPPPTSSNLYNDKMFVDERYNPATIKFNNNNNDDDVESPLSSQQQQQQQGVEEEKHDATNNNSMNNFSQPPSINNNVNNNYNNDNNNNYTYSSTSKYTDYGDDMIYDEGMPSNFVQQQNVVQQPQPPRTSNKQQPMYNPIAPPSPFTKRPAEWVDSKISAENEWEHRRLASLSTLHSTHVGSMNYIQDYHRKVLQEACSVDYILEEARDMLYQAKSMAKRCIALKHDQPHDITKKLWDMLRNKYHPNDIGIKLFHKKSLEDNKSLKEELNSMKAQLSHCLGLLDTYKDQRDLLAKDNEQLREELTRVYVEQEELTVKLRRASGGYERPSRKAPLRPRSSSRRRRRSSSGGSSTRSLNTNNNINDDNGDTNDQIYSNYSHSTNKSQRRLSNGRRPSFR